MKENVKVDGDLVEQVRKESKKRGQTIGGFFELAAKQSIKPQYIIRDNCDAFRAWLDSKDIKWKSAEHCTILFVADPISVGMEWGVYEYLHKPKGYREPLSTEVRDKY